MSIIDESQENVNLIQARHESSNPQPIANVDSKGSERKVNYNDGSAFKGTPTEKSHHESGRQS